MAIRIDSSTHRQYRKVALTIGLLLVIWAVSIYFAAAISLAQEPELRFAIEGFDIEGNSVLDPNELAGALKGFLGEGRTARDVEDAREALEAHYHEKGFPTVLVNIPEQSVDSGMIRLEVIESRIRRVRVTGNRYFSRYKMLSALPSLAKDNVLYLPQVQAELARLNRSPDLKVAPVLVPGPRLGTIDVELKVKDRLPLHGSMELNNRSTHATTDLRLNGMLRYDNLWQEGHSSSFQFQTSPQDTGEVKSLSASYVMPTPWNPEQVLAIYGVWSDSETAFGEGFRVIGKGNILGFRNVMPMTGYGTYSHNLTAGIDYKDFDESLGFQTGGAAPVKTPITYLPLALAYSGSMPDKTGLTQFSAGLNMSFRGWVTNPREFEVKRYKARGNYLYATAGIERSQKLPWKTTLFAKIDGQIADQPLISNEQYVAGGLESVRGYKESEASGDHAVHVSVELNARDVAETAGLPARFDCYPYLFGDGAWLAIADPLPGEAPRTKLSGVGFGARGLWGEVFEFDTNIGFALEPTDNTNRGDCLLLFKAMVKF